MLYKETVKPATLDLILELMKDQQLNSFYLVGGTTSSLRIGHRESIDCAVGFRRPQMSAGD